MPSALVSGNGIPCRNGLAGAPGGGSNPPSLGQRWTSRASGLAAATRDEYAVPCEWPTMASEPSTPSIASRAGRMRSSNPASGSCNGRSGTTTSCPHSFSRSVSSSQHEGSCQAPWIRQKAATPRGLPPPALVVAKKRPAGAGLSNDQKLCGSLRDLLDAGRSRALGAGLGLVLDLRALFERTVAVPLDRAEMDEHVVRAIVGCNELVAFVVAEPLDGSGRHLASSNECCEREEAEKQQRERYAHLVPVSPA